MALRLALAVVLLQLAAAVSVPAKDVSDALSLVQNTLNTQALDSDTELAKPRKKPVGKPNKKKPSKVLSKQEMERQQKMATNQAELLRAKVMKKRAAERMLLHNQKRQRLKKAADADAKLRPAIVAARRAEMQAENQAVRKAEEERRAAIEEKAKARKEKIRREYDRAGLKARWEAIKLKKALAEQEANVSTPVKLMKAEALLKQMEKQRNATKRQKLKDERDTKYKQAKLQRKHLEQEAADRLARRKINEERHKQRQEVVAQRQAEKRVKAQEAAALANVQMTRENTGAGNVQSVTMRFNDVDTPMRIPKNARAWVLMTASCHRLGCDVDKVRFVHDGKELKEDDIIETVGLTEDAPIEIISKMLD